MSFKSQLTSFSAPALLLLASGCSYLSVEDEFAAENLGEVGEAITGARYEIRAAHSSKCLDVSGGSTANGTAIQQWKCNSGSSNNRRFDVWDNGGNSHTMVSALNGNKAVEVSGWDTNNGAKVQIWDNGNGTNQRWQLNSLGGAVELWNIRPTHDLGAALEVSNWSTADGAKVQTWDYGGGTNQRFLMQRVPVSGGSWHNDFWDAFDYFDGNKWQDQILWVNSEDQCYVRNNAWNTREVSNGTLKLRVVDTGSNQYCDNYDKNGNRHYDTRYVAGRIATKNKKEFMEGKWNARIKLWSWTWANTGGPASGVPGMFPAWWVLGFRNNEPPIEAGSSWNMPEDVCWPKRGSGEIDIFEHYGAGGPGHFTARGVVDRQAGNGTCNDGDWSSYQRDIYTDLSQWHMYSVEKSGGELIFKVDDNWAGSVPLGDEYPEPMFAILNYAKIQTGGMGSNTKEWVMEVDWVSHESWY